MKHIDLFSGIGGFALATEAVWGNVEHIFCDNDPFCQTILKKHWPKAQIYGDIRTFTKNPLNNGCLYGEPKEQTNIRYKRNIGTRNESGVYILTGGFPCQPFSQAGRRKGTEDDNGNRDALHCGKRCDIIEVCNGDTTTFVRDAGSTRGEGKTAVIADPVQPNIRRSGGQKTSNENEQTTGSGISKRSTRFTSDMEGNADVAERATSHSSQSTTRTEEGTRSGENITAKLGNSSSKRDTRKSINSSATTATTQSTTSESAPIKDEGIFLLTGGFPCQPFSQAGRRKGTGDDRYLWPEMLRVIREFRPQWVIGENVAGLLTISEGLVFQQVCADLEAENYEVQPFVIPAVAVNAPHRRDRVWIVAHRTSERPDTGERNREGRQVLRDENGDAEKDKPQGNRRERGLGEIGSDAPDTKRTELTSKWRKTRNRRTRFDGGNRMWNQNWLEIASALCDVSYGLPSELVRHNGERDRNYPWWRTQALKAGGNSIVPQVAEQIMRGIKLTQENE